MATLNVSNSFDYRPFFLNDIDGIFFNNSVFPATATFASTQFDNVAIRDNVQITGSPAGSIILVTGGSVNASLWSFFNWTGSVQLIGGAGNDTIIGASQSTLLDGGDGNDLLTGRFGADDLYGGNGNDTLDGGSSEDDCYGGAGNDTFKVTGGHLGDNVYGGADNDTLDLSGYSATAYLVILEQFYRELPNDFGAAGEHDLQGVENVRGTIFNDIITGNGGNNILVGGGGEDVMAGSGGNDSFYVDNAGDAVSEAAGALAGAVDTIFASISYTSALNVERMYLTGTANINGTGVNGQNDIMYGNSGANILNGLTGTDNMNGGNGSDTYYVNTSGDVINEAAGAGTLDTVFSQSSFTISANVERLILLDGGNYNANGRNGQNDILVGNDGANIINGFSGIDKIHGGLGNDTLTGGAGFDTFQFLTAPNSATNRDVITDFNVADDAIQLDNTIYTLLAATGVLAANLFKNLNLGAQDADDRILYNDTSGAIFYDTNGLAAGGVIQFATLTGSPTVTNADFVVV